jgi:hypothetical protein
MRWHLGSNLVDGLVGVGCAGWWVWVRWGRYGMVGGLRGVGE